MQVRVFSRQFLLHIHGKKLIAAREFIVKQSDESAADVDFSDVNIRHMSCPRCSLVLYLRFSYICLVSAAAPLFV